MSVAVNGLLAALGWSALVRLSVAPRPLPTVALVVAGALLVGSIASLVFASSATDPSRAVVGWVPYFGVSARSRGTPRPDEPPIIPAEGREPALLIASRKLRRS